uniref:Cytoplasmic protein n=1 Tax=Kwoniella bestiolae CBS 10118 TaxID=1296100 RepID=A0A1B9G430_9TREE|nr:cytoplasmic protein [Kwoniella bestiolae CBS 10118]OCF25752.1 cytoplasmic protein [Kwoniella bestiolae CBS 10118]
MTIVQDEKIPVTCFTGFLGAVSGKTSTILSLIQQLPKDYKVVLLKNEYGDVEVDSLLASQSNISGVSEILNGCLCCTMVGLVENALKEIRDTMKPDRIIIESSGSAFPATLALQIRQLEPEGFKLDGVVTVVDCLNFKGYEDSSPSAKLQAKYTDLLLLSKHQLTTERQMDDLIDSLNDLNDETPKIKVGPSPDNPPKPEVIFGLDTKLFGLVEGEKESWDQIGGKAGWHGDEVETKQIYIGRKGKAKFNHQHEDGKECGECSTPTDQEDEEAATEDLQLIDREMLERELTKLSFEIYRVKGLIRLSSSNPLGYTTNILNYAFGRFELTPIPSMDDDDSLTGVSLRLTVMGERGETARRAKKLAEGLGARME